MRNVNGSLGAAVAAALAVFAALAVLAPVAPAAWLRDVAIPVSPLDVTFDAKFSPRALPETERAPVSLTFGTTIANKDGSHPPALEELVLKLDRNSLIDVTGVPSCEPGGYDIRRSLDEIKRICKDSIVGGGRAGFEIAFPELAPVASSPGALAIFNGGTEKGRTVLFAVTEMTQPVVTMTTMRIDIRRNPKGRVGMEVVVSLPKVVNGYASATDLSLTLYRRISGRPSKAGVLSARCPEGESLADVRATFADGDVVAAGFIRRCRSQAG
jgi:hypothetical protein